MSSKRTPATIALIVACLPALASYVRRLVGDGDLADDVVQEVCLRALAGEGPRFPAKALAWSRGIARHVVSAEWRRRRRGPLDRSRDEASLDGVRDCGPTPEEVVDARVSLTRMFREGGPVALLLRRYAEAGAATVLASEVGLTPAALRMRLLRLRRTARKREQS
jgi:DNA-directed RNA polymerase specialized sigma24 family protein